MKKILSCFILFLLILLNSKTSMASNNNVIKISHEDYTINIYAYDKDGEYITVYNLGDKLSDYRLKVDVFRNGEKLKSTSKWRRPNYEIISGKQVVKISIDVAGEKTFNVKTKITGGISALSLKNRTMNELNSKSRFTHSEITMDVGTQFLLNINSTDTVDTITWETSDDKVATVDNIGVVTAHKLGVATIKATITNMEDEISYLYCTINVGENDTSTSIELNSNSVVVTDRFKAKINNLPIDSSYIWNVSDRSKMIITPNTGTSIALSEGNVYIYCTITTSDNGVYVLSKEVNILIKK